MNKVIKALLFVVFLAGCRNLPVQIELENLIVGNFCSEDSHGSFDLSLKGSKEFVYTRFNNNISAEDDGTVIVSGWSIRGKWMISDEDTIILRSMDVGDIEMKVRRTWIYGLHLREENSFEGPEKGRNANSTRILKACTLDYE